MPTIKNFQQILNIHKCELSTDAYKMRYTKTVRNSEISTAKKKKGKCEDSCHI